MQLVSENQIVEMHTEMRRLREENARLSRDNAKLRQQIKDAEEDHKAERYYRDAPQSHE